MQTESTDRSVSLLEGRRGRWESLSAEGLDPSESWSEGLPEL
jgi:hypothetical protein